MKKIITLMVLATLVLTGCNKDKITNLDEKIIGKWVKADINGQPAPTNEKVVYTFVSATEAYRSGSFNQHLEAGTLWNDNLRMNVVIDGNKITLTGNTDEHKTSLVEMTFSSINDKEFTAEINITVKVDGKVVLSMEETDRFVRVTDDYKQAILGTWEGHMTSDFSEYGDNEIHRWEYLADGTYRFYLKEGNSWVPSDDAFAQYFVDGNLLCTRWKNNGEGMEEHREWWEIVSIENGVMNWTALRKNADGTTYTATFSMTKVEAPDEPGEEGDYVDLGLPSGTLWKTTNETNPEDPEHNFYKFDDAVAAFGDQLPTKQQLQELMNQCQWAFDDEQNTVTLTGPNGNTIVLPKMGKRGCKGNVYYDGSDGYPARASYWSRTEIDETYAWRLDTGSGTTMYMYDGSRCAGASIRLVK